MNKLLIALLVATPIVVAQDDPGSCETATECCAETKACIDTLATTREDLGSWKTDRKKLSSIERDLIRSATKTLQTKDASMKALAPTFAAQADLLLALSAIETNSSAAKVANALSLTYRAMARTVAGKQDAYPAPAIKTMDDIKAALKKAELDSKKASALWAAAKKAKLSEEDATSVKDALDLMKQTSPRMRALAKNAKATSDVMGKLSSVAKDGDKANGEGDPRPAIMKTAKNLQKLATPYFKGVTLTAPAPMAPAPST